ncbi:MAG: hypothetical protein AB8G86_17810 [Saprospiraceae bacterium]
MKKTLLIVGILITLISLFSILPYIFDYSDLSKYGKGYITGKVLLLLIGIALIVIGKKKKPAHNRVGKGDQK